MKRILFLISFHSSSVMVFVNNNSVLIISDNQRLNRFLTRETYLLNFNSSRDNSGDLSKARVAPLSSNLDIGTFNDL